MACYKRHTVSEIHNSDTDSRHINNKQNPFSLSIQLQIKSNKFIEKLKNTQTLELSRIQFSPNSVKFIAILRDSLPNLHHRITSPAIQAWIRYWRLRIRTRSQRKKRRRRKKENSRILNRLRERRRITSFCLNFNQESTETESNWSFSEDSDQISEPKSGKTIETYLLMLINNVESQLM